ncbi:MAG: hypothetical protein B6U89_02695 [Desulfurococcales archaeon ex4484_58]|nr:MAG: hypothetical protein B6U89_02695 [Desulfurococcales archaeon ex4484_58]
MKRYIWVFDLFTIFIVMITALIGGYILTYLLSCGFEKCGSRAIFRDIGPAAVLIIGGLAVFGTLISLTRPVSDIARSTVVEPKLAEYAEKAIETGHQDLLTILNAVFGAGLAFLISLLISWYIL